jgi:hypothetical protein
MHKETSSSVSTLAAHVLGLKPRTVGDASEEYFNDLLDKAKTLAGSCMSQDETKGPGPKSKSEIHPAPAEFSDAQVASDPILHYFHYAHLPPKLQATSRLFFILAAECVNRLPRNAERTVALRKLLEAKDAAVRANVPAPQQGFNERQSRGLASQATLDEPKEIGGHDEDRDGPIPFND